MICAAGNHFAVDEHGFCHNCGRTVSPGSTTVTLSPEVYGNIINQIPLAHRWNNREGDWVVYTHEGHVIKFVIG